MAEAAACEQQANRLSSGEHTARFDQRGIRNAMSDTISETKACDLLSRLFRARGYTIARNVLFREYGVEFHVDGWDEKARVGFEFLSSEDEDHIDLSLEEYQTLSDAQRRGELAIFIIDEVEPLSAAELVAEATEFLDEAATVVRARRRSRPSSAGVARGQKARGGSKGKTRNRTASGKQAASKQRADARAAGKEKKAGLGTKAVGRKKARSGSKKTAKRAPKSSGRRAASGRRER